MTSPRRVLHVLKSYRPQFTGEGVFLERSSAVMQELARDVTHELLVTHTPRPEATAWCGTLARVTWLTTGPVGDLRREAMLCWWFLRHLHRYEVVHFRTHADWYFLSYAMTKLAGRRLLLSATLDDSLPVLIGHYRPLWRQLAARGFRLFDGFISISPRLHAQSAAVAAAPCHLLPCGITVPAAQPGERARMRRELGLSAGDPLLIFVGGLCARKDPATLIAAMPAILAQHPGAKLLLVGPALEPDHVRALEAAARPLCGAVIFAGEQSNPHPWFAAADILVFASRLEGFGTVVPEAMAHGLPVVARRLPGVNDGFVLEGETGLLFDDAAGYLAAVLRLAASPELRARMGRAGAALVAREFDMARIATGYLALYGMADAVRPLDAPETRLAATASIPDRRFHSPVPVTEPARLITMVDAEEAFDWSRPFSREARDVSSMRHQHLAHRVFERHGVVPVYLADHPVVAQDDGRAPLQELLRGRHCEIGAQLHPWVTPPFTEAMEPGNSFAGNLPVAIEVAKARTLTEALGATFGQHPLIYRTGRFGVGPRTADILKHLGYAADSSVAACWPPGMARGDAEAWRSGQAPYWVDRDRTLMEIPVTAALVGRLDGRLGRRLAPLLFHPAAERLRLPGLAARMGLMERIRLTPEGMTLEEAKRLTRALHAAGQRVFVLTYHSPSLVPGNTPYVRTLAEREAFLAWLDGYYSFFREEIGGRSASWREIRYPAEAAPQRVAAE